MNLLETTFLQNTLQNWLVSIALAALAFLVLRTLTSLVTNRLSQLAGGTETKWDDILASVFRRTRGWILLIFAIFLGTTPLLLPPGAQRTLNSIVAVALFLQTGLWISAGIKGWLAEYREKRKEDDATAVMTMNVMGIIAQLVLWSFVLLLSLDNMGVDVTALVAGLGVGGVAVALAAQNILGDLFASLSIVMDKPFVLGDFLMVGDHLGSVEYIGMKTTRLRSLSGEQLVFSNADLLGSRIRNYGRMYERRVPFKIGVTYQTPHDKLEKIPEILREAIESLGKDEVRFDRSHFQGYGDFALTFETVYYVLSPDYNHFMDCQQTINLTIHRRFEEEGIEFAYPTQTLFLERAGRE